MRQKVDLIAFNRPVTVELLNDVPVKILTINGLPADKYDDAYLKMVWVDVFDQFGLEWTDGVEHTDE